MVIFENRIINVPGVSLNTINCVPSEVFIFVMLISRVGWFALCLKHSFMYTSIEMSL